MIHESISKVCLLPLAVSIFLWKVSGAVDVPQNFTPIKRDILFPAFSLVQRGFEVTRKGLWKFLAENHKSRKCTTLFKDSLKFAFVHTNYLCMCLYLYKSAQELIIYDYLRKAFVLIYWLKSNMPSASLYQNVVSDDEEGDHLFSVKDGEAPPWKISFLIKLRSCIFLISEPCT